MTWPRGWSIHRKLVAIALVVTMVALLAATVVLTALVVFEVRAFREPRDAIRHGRATESAS